MNILFVCHNAITSNSGIHILNLASQIRAMGEKVAIATPGGAANGIRSESRGLRVVSFGAAAGLRFKGNAAADLVHGWSPRQHVAKATRELCAAHDCRYLVHLEDHEPVVTAGYLNIGVDELRQRAISDPEFTVPEQLAHPADMQRFLEGAAGVTAVLDRLLEFKPVATPGAVIRPAAEDELFFPQPASARLRAKLRIAPERKVIVYNGNTHPVNAREVRALYDAVLHLAERGVPITLVRLGDDWKQFEPPPAAAEYGRIFIQVRRQPRAAVPRFLALADVLVQPGAPDAFNSYRFPSKLPEFFAMGRPVVLPAANIGLEVKDGEEALLLETGNSSEIAGKVAAVLADRELAARLAAGARRFYERSFDWKRSASQLLDFYRRFA